MKHRHMRKHRCAQTGIVLIFALFALMVLALAGVSVVRSIDTGVQVVGNVGFKQEATASSDIIANEAVAWLAARVTGPALDADDPDNGYYASSLDALDPTGNAGVNANRALVDWGSDGCEFAQAGSFSTCVQASPPLKRAQNAGHWVITRLCKAAGSAGSEGNSCAVPLSKQSVQSGGGEAKYGAASRFTPSSGGPYYRIIVRNAGVRGTVSFTETLVYF